MKRYIAILITSLLISSCADELNLEPQNSITEDLALADADALQSVLVGAYDRMTDDDLYGGWFQMTSDLLGTNNDVNWAGTFTEPGDMWNKVMTSNNAQVEVTWTEGYEAINTTNIILAHLDVVEDDDERARMEGEAKFIRGSIYFDLVRLFGKDWADGDPSVNLGIPLKLTPTNLVYDPAQHVISRSTVADVYDQVISDLTDAEAMLPEENGFYATTWSAKAMLARVALQQRNYDEARIKANDIIENGPFSLVERVAQEFNQDNNTSEDIFAVQITNQDGENALQTFYAATSFNGRRDIRVRAEYEALFDETDERYLSLIYFDASDRRLSGKFQDQFGNIPLIRLAEMYLIRAEGNLLAGGQVGSNTPGEDLQVLRDRARATNPAPADPTIDDIMLERKLELAFEGNFLHDIRRREATIEQRGTFNWNADELVLPIPQRELDSNSGLKGQQNPGYGI